MSGGSGTGPFVAHSFAGGLAGGGDPGFARAPSFTTASALVRGKTSGHEQDGELRERSALTAAGRPRQPQAMPSDTPSVTELWMEQNRLLMQQLQALQTQVSGQQAAKEDQTHSSHELHEPKQLLEGIDPGLKKVFEDLPKKRNICLQHGPRRRLCRRSIRLYNQTTSCTRISKRRLASSGSLPSCMHHMPSRWIVRSKWRMMITSFQLLGRSSGRSMPTRASSSYVNIKSAVCKCTTMQCHRQACSCS